ncbi:MAG: IS21 family transposase, partial [Proteobacteria bacterium]|nr:IS21 family transposase [Pseudomonadota bacterium]
ATRAVALGAMRYKNLASMLKTGLDRAPLPASAPHQAELALPDAHANLRGAHYYH